MVPLPFSFPCGRGLSWACLFLAIPQRTWAPPQYFKGYSRSSFYSCPSRSSLPLLGSSYPSPSLCSSAPNWSFVPHLWVTYWIPSFWSAQTISSNHDCLTHNRHLFPWCSWWASWFWATQWPLQIMIYRCRLSSKAISSWRKISTPLPKAWSQLSLLTLLLEAASFVLKPSSPSAATHSPQTQ